MLEKRLGPRTCELRTINLIEADLQIVMKVCLQVRRGMLRANERVSECNYGARRWHSIVEPLLEKILNIDNSIINGKKNTWLIADWKACFDRQLPEIGALTCRSLGLEVDMSKMLIQVLSQMKFVLKTSNATLQATHDDNEILGGTGQGSMLSATICVA